MIKALIIILLALPLVSFAPVPQACDEAAARQSGTVLRQVVTDPAGIPYGEVRAWSCGWDTGAAIAELRDRQAQMQNEAAAYRAAHPLK